MGFAHARRGLSERGTALLPKAIKKYGLDAVLLLGCALYAVSLVWLNFHGSQWFNFDMYSDQYVAKLMAESKTLFPPNWIFGNQYYVVATPALAALLLPLCANSYQAMALASSLMLLLILAAFLWCCKPFFSPRALLTGLFCLSGAVILGESASSYMRGFQLFYTMASYYACYVFGLLFHFGIYFRLRSDKRVSPLLWVAAIALCLAFGLQSPRETLLLNIPLLLMELWNSLRSGWRRSSAAFVLLCFAANLAGLAAIRFLPVRSSPIIGPVALDLSPAALLVNLADSSQAWLQMSGLPYLHSGWKWKPIGLMALFFWAVVLFALGRIAMKRDRSAPAQMTLLCLLSVLCVYGVGIFLFRTRDIYYFVWVLLVVFSFSYLFHTLDRPALRRLLLMALLACGLCSYVFNFYPDLRKYPEQRRFYMQLAQELAEEDVRSLYVDFLTPPTLAACSDDRMDSATFQYAFDDEGEGLLQMTPHLRPADLLASIDPAHSLVVLSDSPYNAYSSQEYVEAFAPSDYAEALLQALQLVRVEEGPNITLYFYRFTDPAILFDS